jgi:hypothetical protein
VCVKLGDFTEVYVQSREEASDTDFVAVDPVSSEPLSLGTGKKTGKHDAARTAKP